MSRTKGMQAAAWVAAWLKTWWPHAEALPAGLPGADIENTPGVAFEVKTGAAWRNDWVKQAAGYGADGSLPVVVYLPGGLGANRIRHAQAVIPMHWLMHVLEEAGYAPTPTASVEEKLAALPHILRQIRAQVGNALPASPPETEGSENASD
jgi:hypothetical protein